MWECFALLVEIVKYCTARITSTSSADYVAALVDQHHHDFRKCYPGTNFTPKLHYMVHLLRLMKLSLSPSPSLILVYTSRLGELVWKRKIPTLNVWHKLAITYSVSACHQRLLCAYLQGLFFNYEDLECGPCMFANHAFMCAHLQACVCTVHLYCS